MISLACFNQLHMMFQVYFMHYLSSDVYYKYLSELINTVQLAADLPQTRKKRSGLCLRLHCVTPLFTFLAAKLF